MRARRRHGAAPPRARRALARHLLRGREPAGAPPARAGLATGLSYPWDRHALSTRPALAPVVQVGAAALRAALPHRIDGMVGAAQAGSAMLHFSVLSRAVVTRCHRRGVAVFAWTVDDAALLERVVAMGVDGVISNDPRIFELDGEPR